MMQSSSQIHPFDPATLSISLGAPIWWDGVLWTIFNPGETAMTLLSEDKQFKEVPMEVFDDLLRQGKLKGLPS
jgi:hypothetical protein